MSEEGGEGANRQLTGPIRSETDRAWQNDAYRSASSSTDRQSAIVSSALEELTPGYTVTGST